MSDGRAVSVLAAFGAAVVLIGSLGVMYGPRAFVIGVGCSLCGWLLHDEIPGRRRDSSP